MRKLHCDIQQMERRTLPRLHLQKSFPHIRMHLHIQHYTTFLHHRSIADKIVKVCCDEEEVPSEQ